MNIGNLEDAKKTLRARGWNIQRSAKGDSWYVTLATVGGGEYFKDHELIKLASMQVGNQYPTGDLKEDTHRRNRAATKQSLVHERYDEFQTNKMRATGNPRDWS